MPDPTPPYGLFAWAADVRTVRAEDKARLVWRVVPSLVPFTVHPRAKVAPLVFPPSRIPRRTGHLLLEVPGTGGVILVEHEALLPDDVCVADDRAALNEILRVLDLRQLSSATAQPLPADTAPG